jgi:anti-sigma factor RsiW
MKCDESRIYLPAYLDDELDVAETLHVQKHLAGCAECRQAQKEYLALRAALQDADLRADPSAGFAKRVKSTVRRAARDEVRSSRSAWLERFRWLPAAAAVLIIAAVSSLFLSQRLQSSRQQLIAGAVVAGHIRSLQADHLVDVPSSDRHTVKPWFQGKLDFSPPVPDLSDLGWTLIGARVDYVESRPVAALVYQRRKHNINVFLWPNHGAADDAVKQESARQGYQILHWSSADMTYWVVSDLNFEELHELARALRSR